MLVTPQIADSIRGKSILVVDDEEDIRLILCLVLKACGARVQEASSGNDALKSKDCAGVDLIISDVRMQDGDGIELLQQMRKQNPVCPPFIFLTGATEVCSDALLELGAQALIAKPFATSEILTAVANVINRCA